MKDELRELLVNKTLQLVKVLEDFEETYMRELPQAKELAEEILDLLELLRKADFVNNH